MARACTVCAHPERRSIDENIVAGASYRSIARQFGPSATAIYRHVPHIPAALAVAQGAAEVAQADDLLAEIRDLKADLKSARKLALANGALTPLALLANAEMRSFELLAKIFAEINAKNGTDVLAAPEWREMRERVVAAFYDDPVALAKLVAALGEGMNDRVA